MAKNKAREVAKKRRRSGQKAEVTTSGEDAIKNIYGPESIAAGEYLQNMIQPGSYGTLNTNVPGQQEVLERMKAGLGGYTSPEYQAQREQMQRGINSQYNTAQGQLAKAQARGKVYGAAGAAQQANLVRATQDSKNNMEQDLYVKNIDEMRSRLSEYGGANAEANAYNRDIEEKNLANRQAEISDRRAAMMEGLGGSALARQLAESNKISKKGIKATNRG